MAKLLVAKESFSVRREGADHTFVVGQTRIREGHPWLHGIEHLFEEASADYEWEQATQAPGEKRTSKAAAVEQDK